MLEVVSARNTHVRSRQQFLTGLLLVALVFRALVPAGFMPAFGTKGAGVTMQVCPLHMPSMGGEAARDGHAPAPPSGQRVHDGSICAFAASAVSAPPPALSGPVVRSDVAPEPILMTVANLSRPSIIRSQSPRAPPAHA
jgi:hypothetical protein